LNRESALLSAAVDAIDRDGFTLLGDVFSSGECAALISEIDCRLASDENGALRRGAATYGARNVLTLVPAACDVWRRTPLVDLLHEVLGDDVCLVRGLYFDKPPEATWSLPWHQDKTITVRDNRWPSVQFTRPTTKAGVPHVEAPRELLERMLTLRIHLDAATRENGPLQVLPGTHRLDRPDPTRFTPQVILSAAGDVLAMRPLLCHCSGASQPGTTQHRRVLHLEFAGVRELPDRFAWYERY
jgi:ectoine hydroxylase-related dioxygenase (phytanoyl-CoA dioxygenase family)